MKPSQCDYCDEGLPLVEGWHLRVDPEGVEGTHRIRCMKNPKNPAAVALGRLGGLAGGKARAAALTPEQRSEAARKAARARWGTKDPEVPIRAYDYDTEGLGGT